MVLIDPEGNLVGYTGRRGELRVARRRHRQARGRGTRRRRRSTRSRSASISAKFRESGDTPLFFPGKVVADATGKRLFIADSTHHRIVVTDLDGNKIAVIGTGVPGQNDGAFDKAQFDDPQGMAVEATWSTSPTARTT